VQDELNEIIYRDFYLVKDDKLIAEYKVIERKDHVNGTISKKEYIVVYNISNSDVDCICRMFNGKGLLCRNAFKILLKGMRL